MSDQSFWMVYGEGQRAPAMKHDTRDSAEGEAKRLARMNPDIDFWVLETVSRAKKVDVHLLRLDRRDINDDDIPF